MIGKILALTVLAVAAVTAHKYSTATLNEFNGYMLKYGKVYADNDAFEHALMNYQLSKARVEKYNAQSNGNNWAGVTKFSDLSPAEFKKQYLRAKHDANTAKTLKRSVKHVLPPTKVQAPTSYDWRDYSAFQVVTAVKDQGQCGSCWAFSATENIESMWALATKSDAPVLSPEQIVDCDTVDQACNGGDTPTAFEYVTGAPGLESESDYPYVAGNGSPGDCAFDASKVVAKISNFTWVIPECLGSCDNQNMAQVQAKLSTVAPFAICVFAEPWQDYVGGIFNDQGCTHAYSDLDHCVQMVGYAANYWIIRNSWAADWGENGYIYVSSKEVNGNLCGVLDEVNFDNADSSRLRKH